LVRVTRKVKIDVYFRLSEFQGLFLVKRGHLFWFSEIGVRCWVKMRRFSGFLNFKGGLRWDFSVFQWLNWWRIAVDSRPSMVQIRAKMLFAIEK